MRCPPSGAIATAAPSTHKIKISKYSTIATPRSSRSRRRKISTSDLTRAPRDISARTHRTPACERSQPSASGGCTTRSVPATGNEKLNHYRGAARTVVPLCAMRYGLLSSLPSKRLPRLVEDRRALEAARPDVHGLVLLHGRLLHAEVDLEDVRLGAAGEQEAGRRILRPQLGVPVGVDLDLQLVAGRAAVRENRHALRVGHRLARAEGLDRQAGHAGAHQHGILPLERRELHRVLDGEQLLGA